MLPADGRVVVVGASLAGVRAAETLRREGFTGALTIIGAEAHWPPYDRPPLSKRALAGTVDPERTRLRVGSELADAIILTGRRAVALDRTARLVQLDDGTEIPYDGLVVATGAHARTLPGTDGLRGVFTLRTRDDCTALRSALDSASTVAVVGAGFIGSEVASTCRDLDKNVIVVEALDQPLVRILGEEMGRFAAGVQRAHGVDLRLGAGVKGFRHRDGAALGLTLTDGSEIDAEVVVVGIGVAPNTGWLEGSGVLIDDGVVCDAFCRSRITGPDEVDDAIDPGIVAAGDVARWFHPLFDRTLRVEHWTNAVEQGTHAARVLVHGEAGGAFSSVPYFWSDQFGIKLQFVGIAPSGAVPAVIEGGVSDGTFVAAYGDRGRTVGVLCAGMPHRVVPWQRRIADGEPFPPANGG